MKQAAPILQVRDLCVSRGGQPVLRGVDLVLRQGVLTALVGMSGSGKTTLARAVMRLLTRHEGIITGGAVALQLPAARRSVMLTDLSLPHMRWYRGRHVALVPQDPRTALNPVRRLGSLFREVLGRNEAMRRTHWRDASAAWLARVGLDRPRERLRQYAHELSGGMQQRVLIAMALASGAEVIIADEPTAALDKPIEAELVTWLRDLQQAHGFAMLWMSHDLTLVSARADALAVLHEGRIVEQGPAATVWARPRHPLTRQLKEAAGDGVRVAN